MKVTKLLFFIALAGCGAKTNEDIAKELITANLKTTLADFSSYHPVNYGEMGSASLPFEETDGCISAMRAVSRYKDSVAVLEKLSVENKAAAGAYNARIQMWLDSTAAASEKNRMAKQSYTPEKLFTMTHAFTASDKSGEDKKREYKFYIDRDFTRIVKAVKVY